VVTYTEKLALEQAFAADELLAKGVYLGEYLNHIKYSCALPGSFQSKAGRFMKKNCG